VQVEAGAELGDELVRLEQRMFHLNELCYEKARKLLEEADPSEWRTMDLINLIRVMNEGFTAITKARSSEKQDPYEEIEGFTAEEMEQFREKKSPNQRQAEKEAEAASPPAEDAEDYEDP